MIPYHGSDQPNLVAKVFAFWQDLPEKEKEEPSLNYQFQLLNILCLDNE